MYILRKTINKAYFWNRTKRNLLKIQRKTLTTYSKKYVIGYIFSADGSEPSGRICTCSTMEHVQISSIHQTAAFLYLNKLVLLKARLNRNVHLHFSDFCKRHRVSHRVMTCWLTSYNLKLVNILSQTCALKGVGIPKNMVNLMFRYLLTKRRK